MSHVAHINESCRAHEGAMSHLLHLDGAHKSAAALADNINGGLDRRQL